MTRHNSTAAINDMQSKKNCNTRIASELSVETTTWIYMGLSVCVCGGWGGGRCGFVGLGVRGCLINIYTTATSTSVLMQLKNSSVKQYSKTQIITKLQWVPVCILYKSIAGRCRFIKNASRGEGSVAVCNQGKSWKTTDSISQVPTFWKRSLSLRPDAPSCNLRGKQSQVTSENRPIKT